MYISFENLQSRLNTKQTDLFIEWHDTPTIKKVLTLLYAYNYNFVCRKNLDVKQSCADLKNDMQTAFYSFYHGNSKPILHVFYNNITGKNDIQYTTQTVIKTYPQHKNAKIYKIGS